MGSTVRLGETELDLRRGVVEERPTGVLIVAEAGAVGDAAMSITSYDSKLISRRDAEGCSYYNALAFCLIPLLLKVKDLGVLMDI